MGKRARGVGRPARGSRVPTRRGDLAALPMAGAVLSRLVADRLRAAGVDLPSILKQVGMKLRQIDDPDERLPAHCQIDFLKAAADVLNDDLLGFRLAQSASPEIVRSSSRKAHAEGSGDFPHTDMLRGQSNVVFRVP